MTVGLQISVNRYKESERGNMQNYTGKKFISTCDLQNQEKRGEDMPP